MSSRKLIVDAELEKLQHESFSYFLHETNPANGLVIDKTAADWPASIAATGLALAAYPVAVERGFMPRAAAVERTLTTLRFFWNSPQGPEPDATGYQGFYYHFLDMQTGRRAWQCELSTVDSAFLLAGALTAGVYFDADTADEHEIRTLADALYRRADWQWAQNGGATVTHGWKPESGFLKYRWEGYDEATAAVYPGAGLADSSAAREQLRRMDFHLPVGTLLTDMNIFTPGRYSRTSSRISGSIFAAFRTRSCATRASTISRTAGAPLMCSNSTRSTTRSSSQAMAGIAGGITASDGPGPDTIKVSGIERQFFDYLGRGVPYGPDDGTLAPWAVVASLPFAPEIVLPALDYCIHQVKLTSSTPTASKRLSTRPTRENPAIPMVGYHRGITGSIRGRSF